jgi:hypothetical protein
MFSTGAKRINIMTGQSTAAEQMERLQIYGQIQLDSLLNVIARELDDFSQNWNSDPLDVPQRFDDLITLVKSAKAVLNNGAME